MEQTSSVSPYQPLWRFTDADAFRRDFIDCSSEAKGQQFFLSVLLSSRGEKRSAVSAEDMILCVPRGLENCLSDEQRLFLEKLASTIQTTANVSSDDMQRAQERISLQKSGYSSYLLIWCSSEKFESGSDPCQVSAIHIVIIMSPSEIDNCSKKYSTDVWNAPSRSCRRCHGCSSYLGRLDLQRARSFDSLRERKIVCEKDRFSFIKFCIAC